MQTSNLQLIVLAVSSFAAVATAEEVVQAQGAGSGPACSDRKTDSSDEGKAFMFDFLQKEVRLGTHAMYRYTENPTAPRQLRQLSQSDTPYTCGNHNSWPCIYNFQDSVTNTGGIAAGCANCAADASLQAQCRMCCDMCATTQAPTPAPSPTSVGAIGDPHMTNTKGQRFDLLQSGTHMLLQIPRGAEPKDTLLRVDADAQHLGSACVDTFIQALNVTGKWADEKPRANGKPRIGGVQYHAKPTEGHEGTNWRHFGKVDLKVVWGHTGEGINYLNVFARHLGSTGYPVGGLLGEDDHTAAATPNDLCKLSVDLHGDLHGKAPEDSDGVYSGSIAEASLH